MYPNTANDLINVYRHFHGKQPPVSHAAEADVATLLLATMWIHQQFLNYIQTNAKPFNEVDKCWCARCLFALEEEICAKRHNSVFKSCVSVNKLGLFQLI